jgi:phosphate transport system substrate-binding protein
MRGYLRITALALVLTVGLGVAAYAATVTLTGAGATFPQPIYMKWIYEHHKQYPAVEINYQGIGSGGGIKAIKARTVDFAGSDAPLTNDELHEMPAELFQIPSVGGAVCVSYNLKGVNKRLRFSAGTIAGMFLGQITRWNDPRIAADNPGVKLPDTALSIAHRSDGSGTTYIFTNYLASVSPTWRDSVGSGKEVKWPTGQGGKGNPGVAALIKQIPGCVGYIELAYALENHIPYADVRNANGKWIAPSVASTTACIQGAISRLKRDNRALIVNPQGAKAYPICGLTYLLFYKYQEDPGKAGGLLAFLKFAMGKGQSMASSLEYAPLPPELVKQNLAVIGAMRMSK